MESEPAEDVITSIACGRAIRRPVACVAPVGAARPRLGASWRRRAGTLLTEKVAEAAVVGAGTIAAGAVLAGQTGRTGGSVTALLSLLAARRRCRVRHDDMKGHHRAGNPRCCAPAERSPSDLRKIGRASCR